MADEDILMGILASGQPDSYVNLLDDRFRSNVERMIEAAPPGVRDHIKIMSGRRSNKRQAQLFRAALRKYGSYREARRYVAPPGKSQHNKGTAIDLRFDGKTEPDTKAGLAARDWVHANAKKFDLYFPMEWEEWHIEPIGSRDGTYKRTGPRDPSANTGRPSDHLAGLGAALSGTEPVPVPISRLSRLAISAGLTNTVLGPAGAPMRQNIPVPRAATRGLLASPLSETVHSSGRQLANSPSSIAKPGAAAGIDPSNVDEEFSPSGSSHADILVPTARPDRFVSVPVPIPRPAHDPGFVPGQPLQPQDDHGFRNEIPEPLPVVPDQAVKPGLASVLLENPSAAGAVTQGARPTSNNAAIPRDGEYGQPALPGLAPYAGLQGAFVPQSPAEKVVGAVGGLGDSHSAGSTRARTQNANQAGRTGRNRFPGTTGSTALPVQAVLGINRAAQSMFGGYLPNDPANGVHGGLFGAPRKDAWAGKGPVSALDIIKAGAGNPGYAGSGSKSIQGIMSGRAPAGMVAASRSTPGTSVTSLGPAGYAYTSGQYGYTDVTNPDGTVSHHPGKAVETTIDPATGVATTSLAVVDPATPGWGARQGKGWHTRQQARYAAVQAKAASKAASTRSGAEKGLAGFLSGLFSPPATATSASPRATRTAPGPGGLLGAVFGNIAAQGTGGSAQSGSLGGFGAGPGGPAFAGGAHSNSTDAR